MAVEFYWLNGRRYTPDEWNSARKSGPEIMRDQAGFKSPIDGSWVEGRAAVRAHERKHEVRQLGNDYSGSEPPGWWSRD